MDQNFTREFISLQNFSVLQNLIKPGQLQYQRNSKETLMKLLRAVLSMSNIEKCEYGSELSME